MAWVQRQLPKMRPGTVVLLNLSGRGDKDVETVRQLTAARDAATNAGRPA